MNTDTPNEQVTEGGDHIIEHPIEVVKEDAPSVLTDPIFHLIDQYCKSVEEKSHAQFTPIHVDEIASRVAKFYELIRKVIDWKEDTILRRSAIERILKRLIFTKMAGLSFTQGLNEQTIAEIITIDLIRGGHLPNDEIPREIIPVLRRTLRKYFYFLENSNFTNKDPVQIKRKINFYTYIVEIAACEIEELLTDPVKENTMLLTMSQMISDRIRIIPESYITQEEKFTQTYIATCRTLYDLDDAFITYHLLKYQYPEWVASDPEFVKGIQPHILDLWNKTDTLLTYPLEKDFNTVCERIDTIFTLIGDYIDAHKNSPDEIRSIILHKNQFTSCISEYYDKRFLSLKKRLFRYAIFSTLSVFLSNGFTFFIIEVPMAELFYEGFNLMTTLIDFIVPSVIMFLLISIIRPPSPSNKEKVIHLIQDFVYSGGKTELVEIYSQRKRNKVLMLVVGILYSALTIITFIGVGAIFYYSRLPLTSVVFDTMTIALTIFAAVMIRNKSKELSVDDKMHVWDFFLDMISVPVAKIGSYLAAKWKEYNVFTIFFNFFIETPFAFFVDFIENWSQFLKERRAELH